MVRSATPDTSPDLTSLIEQVQWLVDRAAIADLLVEFARTLDERAWAEHIALYLPDGTFSAGAAVHLEGHEQLWRTASPMGLGRYAGTWHLSSNHAITIDGDTACSRSYLVGVHLLGEDATSHADGGGWYDCTLRRTSEGRRFATVRVTEKWRVGRPLPHMEVSAPS